MITHWVRQALYMTTDWDTCQELWRSLRWARRKNLRFHWRPTVGGAK